MKKFTIFGLVILAMLFLVSVASAAAPVVEELDVVQFMGDFPPSDGASATLTRFSDRVHLKLDTNNLEPGAAYTNWWIVFNNPQFCLGTPCGFNDLFIPDVQGSVLWATGHIIPQNGTAHFNAILEVGNPPGEVRLGDGLLDAVNAEIHIVVRSHGQPIPGIIYEMTHYFNGGCDVNTCEDHQAAIPIP